MGRLVVVLPESASHVVGAWNGAVDAPAHKGERERPASTAVEASVAVAASEETPAASTTTTPLPASNEASLKSGGPASVDASALVEMAAFSCVEALGAHAAITTRNGNAGRKKRGIMDR